MKVVLHGRCTRKGLADLIENSEKIKEITIIEVKNEETEVKEDMEKGYLRDKDSFSHTIFENFKLQFDGFTCELELADSKLEPQQLILNFEDTYSTMEVEKNIDFIEEVAFNSNGAKRIERP